ncbi:MAG TPA: ABC transporter ATP-binding protein [Acetobacteraceae bacterium]|jgi:putative spermidine/putrescine transport system ATP-binding protein|nr:ABC transporter ATP-binding protein [Acetobacteraceae bacterium]
MSSTLKLEGLTKHFGTHAVVRDVTLEVAPGELIVLLGPSGCGKTTTLRLIAGFVTPTEGDIRLDGRSIAALPPHRREMGIVFQSYALFPHLSVARNVAFGLEMRRAPAAAVETRVAEMLRMVKLEALAARLPRELSGGQQQRVALARALAIHPRLLLLDEPLSNLDAALRQEMAREIRLLQRAGGITTIMVTHDQTEAMAMADRLVVMHEGRVQQIGAPEAIHAQPANPFVARFIGGSNILSGRLDGRRLVLADGTALTLAGRYATGGDATLAVRPDSVHLLAPDGAGGTEGEVELCTWLGSVVEHVVRLGPDSTVLTRGPALGRDAVRRHPPGTRVALAWEPDEERLFDAEGNALTASVTLKETNDA